jgi:PIN domain nuclease of toxin-antitoxin system
MIHLDTHVVLWLYDNKRELFPTVAREAIEEHDLFVSPMVLLELEYLHEVGRIKIPGSVIVEDLAARIGLRISKTSFENVVTYARKCTWTRDPFDRLIASNAVADGCRLVSADRTILANCAHAIWEQAW